MRRPLAVAVGIAVALAFGSSAAQRRPQAEAEALAHIFSAFTTQADPGVLNPEVRLGPELAQALALPPGADSTRIYEALVELAGDKFDVRKATPAEVAAYGARRGLDPQAAPALYTLEAGARRFLIQYDEQVSNAVFVGQLGLPDPEVRPVAAKPDVIAATGMTAGARKPEAPRQVSFSWTGQFEFDQAALAPEAQAAIDEEIVPKLRQLAEIRYVIVSGHADRKGAADYNQQLSEARAAAVRDHLVASGIDPERIEIFGYGKTMPVKACPDVRERSALIACLAPNRRVVVEINGIPATL